MSIIKQNIKRIREELKSDAVLVAVTKTRSTEEITEVLEGNIYDLGENRVQEFREKYEIFPKEVRWHFIGRLQKNKVKYLVGKVHLIHSVDSFSLAKEISKRSIKENTVTNVLIQINVSKEESKQGIDEKDLEDLLLKISDLEGIYVKGIMTMAPYDENKESLRELFRTTAKIYDRMKEKDSQFKNSSFEYLSMGMTNDYQIALEEGANMVRIGRGLFEKEEE
ncbi:MAG TPA: YggS family pyridoxal phosphate-dependent enzyme [Eubacteriaceae bacterium]|nr:YggS family pyridoxal phosphate-dependent enzyme [Eubacteriaceae bacterium]